MEQHTLEAMRRHCDKLAENGKELSVAWKSHEDSGSIALLIDGVEIHDPNPIEQQILTYLEGALGYGDLREDFAPEGTAVYDKENNCFTGVDHFAETKYDGKQQCAINIYIPGRISFDSIIVTLTTGDDRGVNAKIERVIATETPAEPFNEFRSAIEQHLSKRFSESTKTIKDFSSISERIIIPRKNFKVIESQCCYTISEFNYQYKRHGTRKINILLVE